MKSACKAVNGVVKLPYACEYTISKIKDRFVTYHKNVYKTYEEIIKNPIYNGYFSDKYLASSMHGLLYPDDLASRSRENKAPFKTMDLSYIPGMKKQAHGIIYTERDSPTNIKYLKVQTYASPDKYTLYGNTSNNNFECRGDKECIMYGHTGGDEFTLNFDSKNYTIADFKQYGDADKIIIKEPNALITPNSEVDIGSEPVLKITKAGGWFGNSEVEVRIEGRTRNEIRGWVDIATGILPESYKLEGKTIFDLPSLQKDNPIQINSKFKL